MLSKILSASHTDFPMLFYLNRNLLVEFTKIKIVIYSILQILTSMRGFFASVYVQFKMIVDYRPYQKSKMAAKMVAKMAAKKAAKRGLGTVF